MEANPETALVELMITNEFGSRFYNATDLEDSTLGGIMDAIECGLLGAGYAQSAIDKYLKPRGLNSEFDSGHKQWFKSEPE